MTKESRFERHRRAHEAARTAEVARAWGGSVPPDALAAFDAQVAKVESRSRRGR